MIDLVVSFSRSLHRGCVGHLPRVCSGVVSMDKVKPVVKAADEEEELVDPLDTLREKCRAEAKCAGFGEKLQECNDRVNSRSQTLETCTEELFDFLHCVDHCASKDIFKHLK
ncbi:hypothetical protein HPB51_024514 [Rhipicephalus microplus]|uniref:Ubiquinol-cytochrome C reductase hinge domain-containing protein n=2 Tax=Rhipicephalus microplus TaxID=6941 RepID=A0A9J6EDJ8_RHIMP|nr:cytochrome b-c1 complex subunit 6, mitochondrial-like [Rhipicephalus microplus]KAH8032385.1 hypothetical protein HPB51_024514 [Rhipicephalus microplus]